MTSPTKTRASDAHTRSDGQRRGFVLGLASIAIGGLVGLVAPLAGLVPFLDPLFRKKKAPSAFEGASGSGKPGYYRICSLDALSVGGPPQRFPVIADQFDAWNFTPAQPIGAVYVQRTGERDILVFNTTCPHAGCSVACDGAGFLCPCHNSSFELNGKKRTTQSGRENPSPRDLDSLAIDDAQLQEGEVWVAFQNYYTGREEKTPKL